MSAKDLTSCTPPVGLTDVRSDVRLALKFEHRALCSAIMLLRDCPFPSPVSAAGAFFARAKWRRGFREEETAARPWPIEKHIVVTCMYSNGLRGKRSIQGHFRPRFLCFPASLSLSLLLPHLSFWAAATRLGEIPVSFLPSVAQQVAGTKYIDNAPLTEWKDR